LKITFLGATGTVTGSKYLIEENGKKILIDCGLFQGLKELRLRNWAKFPIDPKEIHSIILTHAHIDHSGFIPRLIKEGFNGRIICTPGTFDLCRILLPDCGHLQQEEAAYAKKKGYSKHKDPLPLFSLEEAERSLKYFETLNYDKEMEVVKGLSFKFINAGHILGAAQVILSNGLKKICFSGDLGRPNDPIMYPPEVPQGCDYLVMESTYGDRLHIKDDPREMFKKIILKTYKRGGVIIIPAFAVGRTQLVLYYLDQLFRSGEIPSIPVFLNSPMAQDATEIFCKHHKINRLNPAQCHQIFNVAKFVNNMEESIALNNLKKPAILIAGSGMATGGRVIHHLKEYAPNPQNTILFTGYQSVGTRGDTILKGSKEVKIHGGLVPVNAEVALVENLSAHPDQAELLDWAKSIQKKPLKVFITHGEPSQAEGLKNKLEKDLGWDCAIPKYLDHFNL
jgi:metallo-beta-lactamase family protein